jgi:alginate O-acetyltransferase complex protein AlgI
MSFTSLSFLGLICALALLTNALPRWRSVLLLAASVVYLASYVSSPVQLLPLAAFLALGYGSVELLRRTRSALLLQLGIALVLLGFVVLKRYTFIEASLQLPFPYLVLGLSYVLFRVLQLMIDAQQGELLARVPAFGFLLHAIHFLAFTAGPIQRYQDFAASLAQPLQLGHAQVRQALARIVLGFVKLGVASAALEYLFTSLSQQLLGAGAGTPLGLAALLYGASALAYTGHLYANFAGYMDIVIGVGWLLGLSLPENFDHPFAARSFLEFWSRWHMTLSSWFKTYLFNPLLKALATRFESAKAAPYLAVVGFFVTFVVMGVWHGSTPVFLIYGLLLGAGASVNKLWQVQMSKRFGKKQYKQLCERPVVIYVSRGLTAAYFALALTCLWVDLAQLSTLVARLGALGILSVYALLTVGAAVAFAAWDGALSLTSGIRARLGQATSGDALASFALAAQILLTFSVGSFFHKAPEFVYRAF